MTDHIENNKLIARFMGYEYYPFDESKRGDGFPIDQMSGWHKTTMGHYKIPDWYLCRHHKDLAYHYRYDWLMPVVHIIGRIGFYMDSTIDPSNKVTSIPIGAPIDVIYNNVVEFIVWYNNSRKSKP